ncbi:TMEM175 family protein [Cryptosporangium phraense]|uniref:TMEM175 family protein n=1 Tax=Cryptosporangium phraense TaxID=2593070 RepID=UPI001478551C|nr:TMEM175 family protein [Cryptosporangium phraense]
MRKERGLERFLTFLDAIVAIAVTLLILPLVELLGEVQKTTPLEDLLGDNKTKIGAFLLSFVVIIAFWRAHHAIFTNVDTYDPWLGRLSLAWALTVIALPFPTQIIAVLDNTRATFGLYVGLLVLSSLLIAAMAVFIQRRPDLQVTPAEGERPFSAVHAVASALLMIVALVIGLAVPRIGFFSLLILFFTGNLIALWERRRRSADTA